MKACQGQHFSIPVKKNAHLFNKLKPEETIEILLTFRINSRSQSHMNSHFSQSDNQLERKKLSKAFEGFQGHEELKDSLPHCLSQSGALLLQSPTHPLHCYVYVVGYLKDEISVKHLSKLVTTMHRDSKDYIRHVYNSCCCHFQWNTCFSSCLYDVLKKSTFTALFATNTG